MKKNYSPWLHQLSDNRVHERLQADIETNVAIVGAGIAGISTAFFVLKHTNKDVVLIDRFKLAHGATGHNAGYVASYFERGFSSLVEEFGLSLATAGQKEVEDAWELLDEMYTEAGLSIPFSRFIGHAGLSTTDQVWLHLENNFARREGGLTTEKITIARSVSFLKQIPEKYSGLYKIAPHTDILSVLETDVQNYIALLSYQKGCINSALFCEQVLLYLSRTYPKRFRLYEHTPIDKVVLKHDHAILDGGSYTITTDKVVLCTNGFESIKIFNESGLDVDTKFHHLVRGAIGYMSGYLEKMNKPPTAISYITDAPIHVDDPYAEEPYFYLTRRVYEYEKGTHHNLISIGGPELRLDDRTPYSPDSDFPDEMMQKIDSFVKKTYDTEPNKKIEYQFTWHGLMGYTRNGVRLVGMEPKNKVLMYNLGCNGIGILPSVCGGKRIADIVGGATLGPSIFDVPVK